MCFELGDPLRGCGSFCDELAVFRCKFYSGWRMQYLGGAAAHDGVVERVVGRELQVRVFGIEVGIREKF